MQDNAATIDVTEQNVQQLLEHSRQVPVLFIQRSRGLPWRDAEHLHQLSARVAA